jgi:aspartate carbamoyltransferase catalytic subunit
MRPDAIALPSDVGRAATCSRATSPVRSSTPATRHEHPTRRAASKDRGQIAGLTVDRGRPAVRRVGRRTSTPGPPATVRVVGPPTRPTRARRSARKSTRLADGVRDADVVIMLRIQRERWGQLLPELESTAALPRTEDVVRPGEAASHHPASGRRPGIASPSPTVRTGDHEPVTNGVAVRMALLYLLVARSKAEDAQADAAADVGAMRESGGVRA